MKKNLQDLSDEELLKEAKSAKSIFAVFLVLMIIMFVSGIIITIKKGMNTFTFLPLTFLGIAAVVWSNHDKMKKEVKSRNL